MPIWTILEAIPISAARDLQPCRSLDPLCIRHEAKSRGSHAIADTDAKYRVGMRYTKMKYKGWTRSRPSYSSAVLTLKSISVPVYNTMTPVLKKYKAAAVNAEPGWFNLEESVRRTIHWINEAGEAGCKFIAFPELCTYFTTSHYPI